MTKVDLVTGFLGTGKTTFIRKYVEYLLNCGLKVGIIENDFGAVNVDMMLLSDLEGENCELEMVSGGCDRDCHRRRFKTKLIAMGMQRFDRVIVEPSGVYDAYEFFDTLNDEPLDRFYEAGTVITIVDGKSGLDTADMSSSMRYMMASQLSCAGCVVVSKLQKENIDENNGCLEKIKSGLNVLMEECGCERRLSDENIIIRDWNYFDESDFDKAMNSGYATYTVPKELMDASESFAASYFMNMSPDEKRICDIADSIFNDKSFGNVMRLKGFIRDEDEKWFEVNITCRERTIKPVHDGQDVIIAIGESLNEDKIRQLF